MEPPLIYNENQRDYTENTKRLHRDYTLFGVSGMNLPLKIPLSKSHPPKTRIPRKKEKFYEEVRLKIRGNLEKGFFKKGPQLEIKKKAKNWPRGPKGLGKTRFWTGLIPNRGKNFKKGVEENFSGREKRRFLKRAL